MGERTPCGIVIAGRERGVVGGLELCTYIISMAMGKSFFLFLFVPPKKSDVSNFEQGDFS